MPENEFVTSPRDIIYHIQRMLHALDKAEEGLVSLNPTGVYNDETLYAVEAFQRSRNLAVTGEVDEVTFNEIANAYINLQNNTKQSEGIYPFERPLSNGKVGEGEAFDLVRIIQIMLEELSVLSDTPAPHTQNGIYDQDTRSNVAHFQALNGMNATGEVDLDTWDALARQYNAALQGDNT